MVKSSIVVPSQIANSSAQKRSVDQEDNNNGNALNEPTVETGTSGSQESKKPRLEMNADSRGRGQRMFGVLLGTLNKFKDDSKQKSDAERKRAEIDSKLHEKLANEKKELSEKLHADKQRRDRETTLLKKREERMIEEKRDATCVKQKEYLANYIKTKTEPRLCYRPKKLTKELEKQIDEQMESAREERKIYEFREEERMKEEESEDELAVEAEEKCQQDDDDQRNKTEGREEEEKELTPRLESPTPEDVVVADRDD
ncbi:hypothetical protein INT45_008064 [Circinella minor]|uniref:Pinin/SDK/MemA protein domain-containing protein n=1 Tax=Circinella minor TaxID=1195481 RepID=A0A8H7RXZ9_9FUNG|nr:hypothetical protein INT45_008064 [Circinella minor]